MFFVMMAKDVNQKYLYLSYSIIVYFIAVFAINKCLYGKFESMQQHKIKAIHYYTHGTE